MSETAPESVGQGSTETILSTPPPAPVPAAVPWLEAPDEVTVGYIQNKGWTKPEQVLDGYRNLEKLLGADRANNAVILPKPDATPQEMGEFYNRLGRPSGPEGYKFQVPEGADPGFATAAAAKMHELGLPQKSGEALATWWNEQAATATAAQAQVAQEKFQADDMALKQGWGAAFQQNLASAQAAARGLGLDAPKIDALQQALGHKATMELLHTIGSKMGEATFVTGDKTERFGNALTPGQAKATIQERMKDRNFVSRYTSGDAEAKAEMARLHEFAFPPVGA